jgi:hypothetical protein
VKKVSSGFLVKFQFRDKREKSRQSGVTAISPFTVIVGRGMPPGFWARIISMRIQLPGATTGGVRVL